MAVEEPVDKLPGLSSPKICGHFSPQHVSHFHLLGWGLAASESLGLPTSLGGKWPQAKMTSWKIKLAQKQI